MPSSTSRPVSHERWRLAALWAGVLTGPLAWLALLEFNYVFAGLACELQATWFLHLANAIALLAVLASGYAARAGSVGQLEELGSHAPALADETRLQRARWMSRSGLFISAWFVIVILAMEVPVIVLKECQ
jgi:hypothetical protein